LSSDGSGPLMQASLLAQNKAGDTEEAEPVGVENG